MRISLKNVFVNMYPQSMADFKNNHKGRYTNEHYRWFLIAAGVLQRNQPLPASLTTEQKAAGKKQIDIFNKEVEDSLVVIDGKWTPRVIFSITLGKDLIEDFLCSSCYQDGESNFMLTHYKQKCERCGHIEDHNITEVYDNFFCEDSHSQMIDNLDETLAAFEFDKYGIEGRNLGWRNRTGTSEANKDAQEVIDFIIMDSDFEAHITVLFDGSIEVTRYHHDSPTGEFIEFKPAVSCDISGDIILCEDAGDAIHLAKLAGILLNNIEDQYEQVSLIEYQHIVSYVLSNEYNDDLFNVINEFTDKESEFTLGMARSLFKANERLLELESDLAALL